MEKKKNKKGNLSPMMQQHWTISAKDSVFPIGDAKVSGKAWLPMEPKNRPTPHVKINESDH